MFTKVMLSQTFLNFSKSDSQELAEFQGNTICDWINHLVQPTRNSDTFLTFYHIILSFNDPDRFENIVGKE